jgi:hypothetical protein
MTTNLTRIEQDIDRLIDEWQALMETPAINVRYRSPMSFGYTEVLSYKHYFNKEIFDEKYYILCTEAIVFIKQVADYMMQSFNDLHSNLTDEKAYYLPFEDFVGKLRQQKSILEGVKRRFTSSLFDIKHLAQADLFDDALDQARYLWTHKYYRASGVVAGVVLEQHLKSVCNTQGFVVKLKHPVIENYRQTLYDENKYITPAQSTQLTYLGQLRNKCGHNKTEEPTKDDIQNLINGVDNIRNTIL